MKIKLPRSKCLTFENFGNFELLFASQLTHMKSGIFIPKPIGRIITDRTGSEVKIYVKFRCPGRSRSDQNWAKVWYRGYKCRNDEPRQIRKHPTKLRWWSVNPCLKYRLSRRSNLRTRPIVTVKTFNIYFKKYFSDSLEIRN